MQVLGLTTALGCISGTSAPAFAVALVFSMVSISPLSASCSKADHDGHNWRALDHGTSAPLMVTAVIGWLTGELQVVMYDASGVRLHAGKQASVLNMIITELPPDHPVSDTRPLRDTLGHTPLQARLENPTAAPCWHSCTHLHFGASLRAVQAAVILYRCQLRGICPTL